MKNLQNLLMAAALVVTLSACSGAASQTDNAPESPVSGKAAQAASPTAIVSDYDLEDLTVSANAANATVINLEGGMIRAEGGGVDVNGTIATVTAAGTYTIQGILDNGQLIVDTQDAEAVTLLLNGADITNTNGAPIYIANAEKVIIHLADGTQNIVSDGTVYTALDDNGEPDAAIFSHDDLSINGNGALTVNANYKNGVASKDDLKIISGTITVNAVSDGLKGKDSVSIKEGVITINAGADGIQSTNTGENGKGYIVIDGGMLNVTAGLDAIQSATSLQINGGSFIITSGGGAVNNSITGGGMWSARGEEGNPNKPAKSAKGLKAAVDITIMAGTFDINTADDALNSNASITIHDGKFQITSGDDGMHANSALTINGGEINLKQSYEGLESAVITINGGTIHITASDDGLNAGGGADGSSVNGRPGQNPFTLVENAYVYVNGGYLCVDANGDGLDTNGSFAMTNGTVIVNGPTNDGNGALDYMGTFNVTGGFLVAVGSSGMAQAPSQSSSQYSFLYNFEASQAAGTLIHIQTQNGEDILTYAPAKNFQSVMLSSPQLADGTTYIVYTGGTTSGTNTDGLYANGTYTPGTQTASFTTSGMTTLAGVTTGGFGPGSRPAGGPGGPGGRPGEFPPVSPP